MQAVHTVKLVVWQAVQMGALVHGRQTPPIGIYPLTQDPQFVEVVQDVHRGLWQFSVHVFDV